MIDRMPRRAVYREFARDVREAMTVVGALFWAATAAVVFTGAIRIVWRVW